MDEDTLILSEYERKIVIRLFLEHALEDNFIDDTGVKRKRWMRNAAIWIRDRDFFKKNKRKKSILSLIKKNILVAHPIMGYTFSIKTEYISRVYSLMDNGDTELVEQLAGVWLETKPH